MKCLNCQKEVPVIQAIDTLKCKVDSCQKTVEVVLDNEEEKVNYSVLCPQHEHRLSFVQLKLFE